MRWVALLVAAFVLLAVASADGEVWEEDDHEVLIRSERGAKNREPCKYSKGAWSECDATTNMRSRTLTLKKGDPAVCEKAKTIQKKCKKVKHDRRNECPVEKNVAVVNSPNPKLLSPPSSSLPLPPSSSSPPFFMPSTSTTSSSNLPSAACRYERGAWSECNAQGEMSRVDKLKPTSDPSCEQNRQMTKKCKSKKGTKPPKNAIKGGRRNRQ